MCVKDRIQFVVRFIDDGKAYIRILDDEPNPKCRVQSRCTDSSCPITEVLGYPDCVLEACNSCDVIRRYNLADKRFLDVITGIQPRKICQGPNGSILVSDDRNVILQLQWDDFMTRLAITKQFHADVNIIKGLSYVKMRDLLVVSTSCPALLKAVSLRNQTPVWKCDPITGGFEPRGLCTTPNGKLYIADGSGERLLVVDSYNGTLGSVQQNGEAEAGWIWDVCWSDAQPHVIVLFGADDHNKKICCYATV